MYEQDNIREPLVPVLCRRSFIQNITSPSLQVVIIYVEIIFCIGDMSTELSKFMFTEEVASPFINNSVNQKNQCL
jgi:hypothetical protein